MGTNGTRGKEGTEGRRHISFDRRQNLSYVRKTFPTKPLASLLSHSPDHLARKISRTTPAEVLYFPLPSFSSNRIPSDPPTIYLLQVLRPTGRPANFPTSKFPQTDIPQPVFISLHDVWNKIRGIKVYSSGDIFQSGLVKLGVFWWIYLCDLIRMSTPSLHFISSKIISLILTRFDSTPEYPLSDLDRWDARPCEFTTYSSVVLKEAAEFIAHGSFDLMLVGFMNLIIWWGIRSEGKPFVRFRLLRGGNQRETYSLSLVLSLLMSFWLSDLSGPISIYLQ